MTHPHFNESIRRIRSLAGSLYDVLTSAQASIDMAKRITSAKPLMKELKGEIERFEGYESSEGPND